MPIIENAIADAVRASAEGVLSPKAAAIIAEIRARKASDPRMAVSRREAKLMLGIGATRELELEKSGELHSYIDGSLRRVTTGSIYAHLQARAIASYPLNGPEAKVRRPKSMLRKVVRERRQPTERELEALARANAKRAADAEARRAARAAAASEPERPP